jgi:hypothetical protein
MILADLLGDRPPRSLAAIRDRARAEHPAARYPGVRALAADLTAWTEDAPVSSYQDKWWEKLGRTLRRHLFVVLLVAAFIVVRLLMILLLRH